MDVPSFNPFDGIDVDLDPSVPDPHDRVCEVCGNLYTPYSMTPDSNTVVHRAVRPHRNGPTVLMAFVVEEPVEAPPLPYRCPRCRNLAGVPAFALVAA